MKKETVHFAAVAAVALAAFAAKAEIDLAGASYTISDTETEDFTPNTDKLSESFVNTSDTTADLIIDISTAANFIGSISGNIRLVKRGSATLSLTGGGGVIDFSGGTALEAGAINYTIANSLGTGLITISGGATLQLGAAGVVCANPIHLLASSSIVKFSANNAVVSGDVTAENNVTFAPSATTAASSASFTGKITLPGKGVLSNASSAKDKRVNFNGAVSCYSISHYTDNKSGFTFRSTENSWQFVTYNHSGTAKTTTAKICFSKGAIPEDSFIATAGTARPYVFYTYGDLSFSYFTQRGAAKGKCMTLRAADGYTSTVTLGSETETTGQNQAATGYRFCGPLSLVYAPKNDDSTWMISSTETVAEEPTYKIYGYASTMTGSFTVQKGKVDISGTATFAKMTNVVVGANAQFVCSSKSDSPLASVAYLTVGENGIFSCTNSATPLAALKHVSIEKSSTLELDENSTIEVETFLVGGRPARKGWYTGADNESPVEGDLKTLPQLKGAGRVYIPYQPGVPGFLVILR